MTDTPSTPAASIIIATYNGLRYLPRCLDAVARELRDGDEVIVVDNCSTDGGPRFIRERIPRVRMIENRENHGFAAACSQGAMLARGHTLVFLNQDTEVQPDWLAGLLDALDADGVGLATSHQLLMEAPDRTQACGQDVHYTGLVFGRGYGRPAASQNLPCDVNAVGGASFAIRRDLWEHLGGFDRALYMYYEETDLSWRALLAGWRSRYAPASRVLHDEHTGRPSEARLYYSFRNRALLLLKNWRPATLWLLAPALLTAEILEAGLALGHGPRGIRAKGRAYWWIATHLPQVRELRAMARAHRRAPDAAILRSLAVEVTPTGEDAGPLARGLVAAANIVFRLNRQTVVWLLDRLGPDASNSEIGIGTG